jgi:uncharacterized membrane protein
VIDLLSRAVIRALPAAAVVWALLVVAAPMEDGVPNVFGIPRLVAASAYAAGSLICHQRPERSFHSGGVQWPVCARCSGLYLSAALGVAWAFGSRVRPVPFSAWRNILVLAAIPTMATVALEWWDPRWSSVLVRAAAAAPLGAAVGALVGATSSFQGRLRGCEPTREVE